jgi:hypothetical protein
MMRLRPAQHSPCLWLHKTTSLGSLIAESLELLRNGDIYWMARSTLWSNFAAATSRMLAAVFSLAIPSHSALRPRNYALLASYDRGIRSGLHKALAA